MLRSQFYAFAFHSLFRSGTRVRIPLACFDPIIWTMLSATWWFTKNYRTKENVRARKRTRNRGVCRIKVVRAMHSLALTIATMATDRSTLVDMANMLPRNPMSVNVCVVPHQWGRRRLFSASLVAIEEEEMDLSPDILFSLGVIGSDWRLGADAVMRVLYPLKLYFFCLIFLSGNSAYLIHPQLSHASPSHPHQPTAITLTYFITSVVT